jgi:hypothetical protein
MPDERDEILPPKLCDALLAIYRGSIEVPSRVDDAIRNAAFARLSHRPRFSPFVRVAAAAVAVAALIAVVIRIANPPAAPQPSVAIAQPMPQDLNGDGRVDVLDALILAKKVQASSTDVKLDFNHDGVIDRKDADAIAMAAVSLGKGTTQ